MRLTRDIVLGGSALIAQACAAPAPEQVFSHASRSVVMVYAADTPQKIVGRGSGVFVARDLLVTNCHVIARGKVFMASNKQKRSPARLMAYDADNDWNHRVRLLCRAKSQLCGPGGLGG